MSDQHQFNLNFNDDDVIQFGEHCLTRTSKLHRAIWEQGKETIKNKLHEILNQLCSNNQLTIPIYHQIIDEDGNAQSIPNNWSDQGVSCEVLRLGSQQWEKGKIRIKFEIEFIPDESEIQEPESCLDDIRREIQKM